MSRAQVNENAGEQYGNTSPLRPQPAVLQNPYCKVKQLYLKRWGFFLAPSYRVLYQKLTALLLRNLLASPKFIHGQNYLF